MKPNIVLIHSHDTGRIIQPYGAAVETPRLQAFAEEGSSFRRCFCAAPTCSPSRAALFTGTSPHRNGMFGLAHLGWRLNDYSWHFGQVARRSGYVTCQTGHQHEAISPFANASELGFEHMRRSKDDPDYQKHDWSTVVAAEEMLKAHFHGDRPALLVVGFHETHRGFEKLATDDEWRYCPPAPCLADTPESRKDFARYRRIVKTLDTKIGAILDAIHREKLTENTVVIITTDHGVDYPYHKTTCSDGGLGVFLMMRGPAIPSGKVYDEMVSHLDIMPTLMECCDFDVQHDLEGKSLWPLLRGDEWSGHKYVFGEQNFHNSYDPIRTVRNERFRYTRRYENYPKRSVNHLCGSESRDMLLEGGWAEGAPHPQEALYDLLIDPSERHNCMGDLGMEEVQTELSAALDQWLAETNDPILRGPVPAPKGAIVCPPEEWSMSAYLAKSGNTLR